MLVENALYSNISQCDRSNKKPNYIVKRRNYRKKLNLLILEKEHIILYELSLLCKGYKDKPLILV